MQDYVKVAARSSALSRVQVTEVLEELKGKGVDVEFDAVFVETTGDADQKTSLRDLPKSDFFTREVDALVLSGFVQVGIHSAKDLPEPIHEGLEIVAITEGVARGDSLVIPPEETLESLPKGALIATSSVRREEAVKELRNDFQFCDIRGTIEKRLEQLEFGRVDGVVIAEAALIRLGLTHLNRIPVPGETVPFQGQLAILARKGNEKMKQLFSNIDSRKLSNA